MLITREAIVAAVFLNRKGRAGKQPAIPDTERGERGARVEGREYGDPRMPSTVPLVGGQQTQTFSNQGQVHSLMGFG